MSRELARLDKPIPPLYMAHFVLRTRDLQGVKTWYEKVLGARAVFENPVASFLTFDREHHRLAIVQKHMVENWLAAMTYLERKFPERWGRRDRLRVEINPREVLSELLAVSCEEVDEAVEAAAQSR